jgi:hypothetical protein
VTAALSLGAGGVVLVGVAAYLGVRAIDLRRESDQWCPFGACSPRGVALNDQAGLRADLATAGFVLGGACLAAAGYLAVTARHVPGGGAVVLAGGF